MPDLFGRTHLRGSRLAYRRREKYFIYAVLITLCTGIFFIVLAQTANRSRFLVTQIAVLGTEQTSVQQVQQLAGTVLNNSYLSLFPKRNAFLIPRGKLTANLKNAFPAIEEVTLERTSLSSLDIMIRERTAFALWCRKSGTPVSAEDCYFLDANGFLFTQAPHFSTDVYMRFIGGIASSTEINPIGMRLFTPVRFKEVTYFLESLASLGLEARVVDIEQISRNDIDFRITLSNGTHVLVSGRGDLNTTLADMSVFFHSQNIVISTPHFLDTADYVDFRFADKVYYKLR